MSTEATRRATGRGPLDHRFSAVMTKSEQKGGWTYVVMSGSADFFATRSEKERVAAWEAERRERVGSRR